MQGLKLAREFYQVCRPILRAELTGIMDAAAVGLVGEGSECFGCDDAQSRDHDFGPAFCLWLPREMLLAEQSRIEAAFAKLPGEFQGFESRLAPQRRQGRVGPLPLEDFYAFFTGLNRAPVTWQEWLAIPEYQLAACTNGEIFEDKGGVFTRWRDVLLGCYPRDVLLKKMAARCMVMAQTGQYNLPRSLQRNDPVAAMLASARFAEAALSFVFLCNRRYMPFYKWAGKLAGELPVLGAQVSQVLHALAFAPMQAEQGSQVVAAVEDFCTHAANHLRAVGLSTAPGNWLWEHGPQIMRHVEEPALLRMDMLQG
ncbi:MAG: DUF4037 domain-containing protein [Desulfovibrio sp.]|uniref:DUF4037 domain-containing protein n=1 Tax=Desulfovibrio sp. TaxID=885 RepID=UPI00135E2BB7|nr:DUF4037 domain-containing protein [Desulfovibrio sp.]MTJ92974.1 DUF4037 domain-containing protein [Desulfovibrio sp.]